MVVWKIRWSTGEYHNNWSNQKTYWILQAFSVLLCSKTESWRNFPSCMHFIWTYLLMCDCYYEPQISPELIPFSFFLSHCRKGLCWMQVVARLVSPCNVIHSQRDHLWICRGILVTTGWGLLSTLLLQCVSELSTWMWAQVIAQFWWVN